MTNAISFSVYTGWPRQKHVFPPILISSFFVCKLARVLEVHSGRYYPDFSCNARMFVYTREAALSLGVPDESENPPESPDTIRRK